MSAIQSTLIMDDVKFQIQLHRILKDGIGPAVINMPEAVFDQMYAEAKLNGRESEIEIEDGAQPRFMGIPIHIDKPQVMGTIVKNMVIEEWKGE